MDKRLFLAIFGFALVIHILVGNWSGSSSPCRKGKKHYQKAAYYIQAGNLKEAKRYLHLLIKACPNYADAYAVLADIYQSEREPDSALKYYMLAISKNPQIDPTAYYLAGKVAYEIQKYDTAILMLERFLQEARENIDSLQRDKVLHMIRSARVARQLIRNPVDITLTNMGTAINTPDPEYFPSITVAERMFIFTRRVNGFNEDFFVATRENRYAPWNKAYNMGPPVNTPRNEGAQALTPDGRYMYFTACNREDGYGRCDLYVAERIGDKWLNPKNLGSPPNTRYWESQPTIGPDYRTLIFASDRPGGYGGLDLWVTYKTDSGWTEPVNLGKPINTAGDEFSPYLHFDGVTLYFASRGHPGMGKADLFMSRLTDTGWTEPINLGYPINTPQEESGLVVGPSGKIAYFAAVRPEGYGSLDIYMFELPEKVRANPVSYIEGRVINEMGNPVDARIEIIEHITGRVVAMVESDPATGKFVVPLPAGRKFAFHVYAEGYLFASKVVQSPPFKDTLQTFKFVIKMRPIKPGETLVLRNVFFETGSAKLSPESKAELDRLVEFLKKNSQLRIE